MLGLIFFFGLWAGSKLANELLGFRLVPWERLRIVQKTAYVLTMCTAGVLAVIAAHYLGLQPSHYPEPDWDSVP